MRLWGEHKLLKGLTFGGLSSALTEADGDAIITSFVDPSSVFRRAKVSPRKHANNF